MMIVEKRIKALRNEKGLTQSGLDMEVNFPHGTIAKVETGKRKLDFTEAAILAKYFNVSLSYLGCETDNKQLTSVGVMEETGVSLIKLILSFFERDSQQKILNKINILYK